MPELSFVFNDTVSIPFWDIPRADMSHNPDCHAVVFFAFT